MNWATNRQLLFALGVLVLVVAAAAAAYVSFWYTPASCVDRRQNQNEEGVDCGGACARLCSQPNISVVWARSVKVAPGVYHAVALVKNPDTAAVGTVPYTVSLFDVNNILIATRDGELALFPGETAPLFEANVITGERTPTRTFIDLGMGKFERSARSPSRVKVVSFSVDEPNGRVTALVENSSLFPADDITLTTLLYDHALVLNNASQTTISRLGPRERREAVFTWQEPFDVAPVQVEIIPRVLSDL